MLEGLHLCATFNLSNLDVIALLIAPPIGDGLKLPGLAAELVKVPATPALPFNKIEVPLPFIRIQRPLNEPG